MEKGIITINSLIHTTVGPNFQDFINNMTNPHDMLSTLAKVVKPSDAQLHRNLENELDHLHYGPKHLGIEAWLQLHNTIAKKAEKINEPPREATSKYLIRHFIRSCQDLNPSLFSAYSQQIKEDTLNITLEDLIKKFNVSYQPPKHKGAFPTLSGEPSDLRRQSGDREYCPACGGGHTINQCWNLFEELQPNGWVVNQQRESCCQQYLKTKEGKKTFTDNKKAFTESPPPRPEPPQSRKKKEDQTPPPIITMVSSSLKPNTNITNLFLYNTDPTSISTGDSSSTIFGYGRLYSCQNKTQTSQSLS